MYLLYSALILKSTGHQSIKFVKTQKPYNFVRVRMNKNNEILQILQIFEILLYKSKSYKSLILGGKCSDPQKLSVDSL